MKFDFSKKLPCYEIKIKGWNTTYKFSIDRQLPFNHTDTYLYMNKLKKWLMVRTVQKIR